MKPVSISYNEEDQKIVRDLISRIDETQKVKVVAGTYGKWAHDFVSPKSPEGKILQIGLKAAPTIIESLHDKGHSDEKRAWLFCLLFSVTGENDPRTHSVLDVYDYKESGWQIWGGREGQEVSGGMSFGTVGTVGTGGTVGSVSSWPSFFKREKTIKRKKTIKHDPHAKLIKVWDRWLEQVDLNLED